MEHEQTLECIKESVDKLVDLIKESNHILVYTGAGVSTSASIPDYRGSNGLWTQFKRACGNFTIYQTPKLPFLHKKHDFSKSEPTFTHMAISELCRKRIVKHVVSQNCDGLHLRSGIPKKQLSEIHGNMFIEICPKCKKLYYRQADVTERTSKARHQTGRKCHTCGEPDNDLNDTIKLYGERFRTKWPMNLERARKNVGQADLVICIGSSLRTLRRYNFLWPNTISKTSSGKERVTKLVIINLQYTPKNKDAVLVIKGRCDLVMQLVMQQLNIEVPAYDWQTDPLLRLATPFTPDERANLNRNLIFETRQQKSPAPSLPATQEETGSPKRENRESPSLFVSELTDDPEGKHLRMRIRAVNSVEPVCRLNNDDVNDNQDYILIE